MSRDLIDSCVDWLGKIPSTWSMCRVKNRFKFHKKVVGNESEKYDRIALTLNGVIKRNKDDVDGLQPDDYTGYQIVYKNDLIFKLIDLENVSTSRVGKSEYEGITSPAYIILTDNHDSRYSLYYFLNMWYQEIFNNIGGDGVRSAINKDTLLKVPFIDMKIEEQRRIAKYLDEKCSKINEIISDNNKEIELINEYKKSLINEISIKGFGEKKKTDIGYIDEVIKESKITKIKYILKNKNEKNHPDAEVLSLYREYGVVPKDSRDDNYNVTSENTESYKYVEVGDLVVNKMKAWQGSLAVSDYEGIVSPAYYVCSFKKNINRRYIHYLLRSKSYSQEFERLSIGIRPGQWDLSNDNFMSIGVIVPSDEEQNKIVDYLDKQCSKLDEVINYRKQIIEKLEEYKRSLIYECVTGKREV